MSEIYATARFIANELEERGIASDLRDTGGGCTALAIVVDHRGPSIETGCILVTDVTGTQVALDAVGQHAFLGWIAGFYPSEDALLTGEDAEWLHAEAYDREKKIWDAHAKGGAELAQSVAKDLFVDWRIDAIRMVDAIVAFIKEHRG